MAEDEELRSLAQELELGKKKKKKKKIALDVVAAEAASLAASGGGGENPAPQPPPSAPQMGGDSQTAGTTPLGVAEPGMEEDGLELELMGKKKKKKKKIDMSDLEHHTVGLPEPVVAPPPPDPKLEESTIQDLVEKELGPAVVDEFMLPKKKKRRRPNITFEGFDVAALEVELNVEDEKAIREGEGGMENDEDLEPTDTVPWMGTDRDYTYDELLERVFNIMRQKNPSMVGGQKKKLVMKPPQVVRVGAKKTSFVNFTDICKLLHRQPKHLLAFLLAELGTSGSVDGNNQLIIKGKFQQKQIETVLRRYIKEYVTCHTCRSPDTILHKETRLFFLQCETCGSRCSVQSIKSGFQAITKGYRAQMRRMN